MSQTQETAYYSPPYVRSPGLTTLDAGAVREHLKAAAAVNPAATTTWAAGKHQSPPSAPLACGYNGLPASPPAQPASPPPCARSSVLDALDLMRSLSLTAESAAPASPASTYATPASHGSVAGTTPACSEAYAPLSCRSSLASADHSCGSLESLPGVMQLQAMLHAQQAAQQAQQAQQEEQQQSVASLLLQQQAAAVRHRQVLAAATAASGGGYTAAHAPFPYQTSGNASVWPAARDCQMAQQAQQVAEQHHSMLMGSFMPGGYGSANGLLSNGVASGLIPPPANLAHSQQQDIWGAAANGGQQQALSLPLLNAVFPPAQLPQTAMPSHSPLAALLKQLPPHLQVQALLQQQSELQQHFNSAGMPMPGRGQCVPTMADHRRRCYEGMRHVRTMQPSPPQEQEPPEMLLGLEGRYQPYCQQVINERLNVAAARALTAVKLLQSSDAAITTRVAGKRFFCSLKEVAKVVPVARLLIVAPDVRTSPTAHINPVAALQRILRTAEANNVPVVFALSRRGIGQVFGRDKSMSIVALMHLEGLEEDFVTMMEEAVQGREQYQQYRPAPICGPTPQQYRSHSGGCGTAQPSTSYHSAHTGAGAGALGGFDAATTAMLLQQASLQASIMGGLSAYQARYQ